MSIFLCNKHSEEGDLHGRQKMQNFQKHDFSKNWLWWLKGSKSYVRAFLRFFKCVLKFFLIFDDFWRLCRLKGYGVLGEKQCFLCFLPFLSPSPPKKAIFLVWLLLRSPCRILRSNLVPWVDSVHFQDAKNIFAPSQALKRSKLVSKSPK